MSESTRTSALSVDIDALVEYLNTASIRLAVFGEFSAGKTTVLNALIGEEILSVAVEPTTAVPTRVRYGREFNIFVERTGGDGPALFEDDPPFWTRFVGRRDTLSTLKKQQGTIRDFLRTWTKEGQRADEVERVVIELPLDWLKGGLELVDTPGVNNEFARHQGFTEQEAGAADIAVLLMDARQGGGKRTEFEFMNEVQAQVERCVVAPNKLDLVPEEERKEFLSYICETALPKHWDGAVTPPVVGISALAALRPGDHDEPDLVDAFADLRDQLERVAEEERGSLLLARKGNPEKRLFARAKELAGNGHYGRAHRLYFDLLDVLGAAGLDPIPAEEGIARCEEHLSAQVDTLDELNERYNEAMALAEEDPDAALEELTAIRDEKEDLRLKDGDLHASIERLERRIEERDAARSRIRVAKTQVEQHRDNENWIEAAEAAQEIPPLIETAELPAETAEDLQQFVARQEQDRDKWCEKRWIEIKDQADACVEDRRFLDAEEYLDELNTVVQYTPYEEETKTFAAKVQEKVKTEKAYRKAVMKAAQAAEILERDHVNPDKAKALCQKVEKIDPLYRSLGGEADLPELPSFESHCYSISISDKTTIINRLCLVGGLAGEESLRDIMRSVDERRKNLKDFSDKLDSVSEAELIYRFPDHPRVKKLLKSESSWKLTVLKFPWEIYNDVRLISRILEVSDSNKLKESKSKLEKLLVGSVFLYSFLGLILTGATVYPYLKYKEESKVYNSIDKLNDGGNIEKAARLAGNSWFYRSKTRNVIKKSLNKKLIDCTESSNEIIRKCLKSYKFSKRFSENSIGIDKVEKVNKLSLDEMFGLAEEYLKSKKIISPPKKNAYYIVRNILSVDESNKRALSMKDKIISVSLDISNMYRKDGNHIAAL